MLIGFPVAFCGGIAAAIASGSAFKFFDFTALSPLSTLLWIEVGSLFLVQLSSVNSTFLPLLKVIAMQCSLPSCLGFSVSLGKVPCSLFLSSLASCPS